LVAGLVSVRLPRLRRLSVGGQARGLGTSTTTFLPFAECGSGHGNGHHHPIPIPIGAGGSRRSRRAAETTTCRTHGFSTTKGRWLNPTAPVTRDRTLESITRDGNPAPWKAGDFYQPPYFVQVTKRRPPGTPAQTFPRNQKGNHDHDLFSPLQSVWRLLHFATSLRPPSRRTDG
jgi:hypothetical protein